VTVADTDKSALAERSSREGFEDNAAFRRLQSLMLELFVKFVEPKRHSFRQKAGLARKQKGSFSDTRKEAELDQIKKKVLSLVPEKEKKAAEKIIDKKVKQLNTQIDQLEERQRVLEAKSSLGAIIGEVLHEGAPRAAYIASTSPRVSSLVKLLLTKTTDTEKETELYNKLNHLGINATQLADLFKRLRPLAGGKRKKPKAFNPHIVISDTIEIFDKHSPEIKIVNDDKVHSILGYSDDLVTAIVNIVGNAVHWLEEYKIEKPLVLITLKRHKTGVSIFLEDNGPGIHEDHHEFVFDVGFSLKSDGGTGLGLNIAREALARSGATLLFHPEYEHGAKFEILYPAELN